MINLFVGQPFCIILAAYQIKLEYTKTNSTIIALGRVSAKDMRFSPIWLYVHSVGLCLDEEVLPSVQPQLQGTVRVSTIGKFQARVLVVLDSSTNGYLVQSRSVLQDISAVRGPSFVSVALFFSYIHSFRSELCMYYYWHCMGQDHTHSSRLELCDMYFMGSHLWFEVQALCCPLAFRVGLLVQIQLSVWKRLIYTWLLGAQVYLLGLQGPNRYISQARQYLTLTYLPALRGFCQQCSVMLSISIPARWFYQSCGYLYMNGLRAQFRLNIHSITTIHPSLCVDVPTGLMRIRLTYRLSRQGVIPINISLLLSRFLLHLLVQICFFWLWQIELLYIYRYIYLACGRQLRQNHILVYSNFFLIHSAYDAYQVQYLWYSPLYFYIYFTVQVLA